VGGSGRVRDGHGPRDCQAQPSLGKTHAWGANHPHAGNSPGTDSSSSANSWSVLRLSNTEGDPRPWRRQG